MKPSLAGMCLALLMLPCAVGRAAEPGPRGAGAARRDALAFRRAGHLRHGINASLWFAQAPGNYGAERLRAFTTEDDLRLMQRLGFDHVRLSIDPAPLAEWQRKTGELTPFVAELDRVVHAIADEGLAVVVDIHPESDYKATLLHGDEGVTKFTELWRALAKHYAETDPELVFFEVMNEPEQEDAFRWQGIQATVARAIREVAPRHTILVSGARYSGLPDLLAMEPIAVDNVIYTFHDYEPFPFTHQGATWTDARVAPLRDVPYPSTPANVGANELQEPTLAGKLFVKDYGLDRWDAARVEATVAFAERWSEQFGVPVYCGEFGVHRPFADPGARARWVGDMRTALERHHLGWAMWDYQTNFGVVTKADGATTVDEPLVRALGLQPAK